MFTSKPVLVVVTAANCGFCKKLHQRWNPIRESIQSLEKVRLMELNVSHIGADVSNNGYPKDMQRYVTWYPTVLLFSGDNWDKVIKGEETKLYGRIMNGEVGNPYPSEQKYNIDSQGISQFIEDVLSDPTFGSKPDEKVKTTEDNSKNIVVSNERQQPDICWKMKLKTRR